MSQTNPPSTDEMTAAIDLVDALEELVGGARRLPFTPSVVVNEEEILELVDRIRLALPDEVAEVIRRAEEQAARVVGEADAKAASLTDEHAIVKAATEQAGALVADAEQTAAAQHSAADDYAREVMQRLEEQLDRWLATVREGLQSLPQPPQARARRRKR